MGVVGGGDGYGDGYGVGDGVGEDGGAYPTTKDNLLKDYLLNLRDARLDNLLLAVGGLVAGVINTLAGGGSLITVPKLVMMGLLLPPSFSSPIRLQIFDKLSMRTAIRSVSPHARF